MKAYNYKEAVYNDCYNFIAENFDKDEYNDNNDYEQDLLDDAFVNDSVTGNASGSYFFNAWKAEEAICHNLYLYKEARFFFCMENEDFEVEKMDVTIRCYLLHECFHRAYNDFVEAL